MFQFNNRPLSIDTSLVVNRLIFHYEKWDIKKRGIAVLNLLKWPIQQVNDSKGRTETLKSEMRVEMRLMKN
jgi:hypothetical protein